MEQLKHLQKYVVLYFIVALSHHQTQSSTQNDAEHLAPRRAKLAAYFPEDYKGEKEEGGAGEVEHKADDARLVRL